MISDAFCPPFLGQKRCRSRPGSNEVMWPTRQPLRIKIFGDMIWVDYDLAYDFGACPQASNVVPLSVESSIRQRWRPRWPWEEGCQGALFFRQPCLGQQMVDGNEGDF